MSYFITRHYLLHGQPRVFVRRFALPGSWPNEKFLRHMLFARRYLVTMYMEHVVNNDCFYRNAGDYKFVSLLDIDEVIVPTAARDYAG